MKIRLENRGTLMVYDDYGSMRITGELSAGPDYTFYADLKSLNNRNSNEEKTEIEDREEIIYRIQSEGRKIGLKILFD